MSSRPTSPFAAIVVPIVALLSLLAVGAANARQPDSPSREGTPTITIHSFNYTLPRSVKHGAVITVVNKDGVHHTVTSNTVGAFSVTVPPHATRSFRAPSTPKRYGFHCTFHGSMSGVLKVR